MNERAWEREREGVKTAGAVQVSKLQSFACNQRSGKGSPQECKPSPGIRLCRGHSWHHLPGTWGTGHPAPTAGDTHGSPQCHHGPAAGCPACWGAPEHARTCWRVHAQIQTHPSLPWILGRFPGKEGCPSALGVAPHQGGVALGTPTAPPALFLHQFLQFSQYCCESLPSPCAALSAGLQHLHTAPSSFSWKGFCTPLLPSCHRHPFGDEMCFTDLSQCWGSTTAPWHWALAPIPYSSPAAEPGLIKGPWSRSLGLGAPFAQRRRWIPEQDGEKWFWVLGKCLKRYFLSALVGLRGISWGKQSLFHGD